MEKLIDKLKQKTPRFLLEYTADIIHNSTIPNNWNQGVSFVTKKLKCSCGSSDFKLLTTPLIEIKGFFKKKKVITHLAPIHSECTDCNKSTLLLNPITHGWSGEFNDSASMIGSGNPQLYSVSKGSILVNYSYQNEENYEELLEEKIEMPEDYFDTVTVYFKPKYSNTIEEVVSYEGA